MGAIHVVLGVATVIGSVLLLALTHTKWGRRATADSLGRESGLAVRPDDADVVLTTELRSTRRAFIGTAIGAAVATVVATQLDVGDWDTARMNTVFLGFVVGLLFGVWIDLALGAASRAAHPGPSVRSSGAPLHKFIGVPAIVISILLSATAALKLARIGYLLHSYGFNPGPLSSTTALRVSIVAMCVLVLAAPVTLFLSGWLSRRRQAAESIHLLAWGDAWFARRVSVSLFLIAIAIAQTSLSFANGARDLIPQGEQFIEEARMSISLDSAMMVSALVLMIMLASFHPWRHYLRALWPEVHAHIRETAKAAKATKRAAERRAYHGLPPE